MHLMSKVTHKCQIPLWERPVGCRRILAAQSQSRPSQRGPGPPPMGSDTRSLRPRPAYFILAASQEDTAVAARPFIEMMNRFIILSIPHFVHPTDQKIFSPVKIDWFGTKTAAHHPSDNSLKLHCIYPFILIVALLLLRWSEVPASCPVTCKVFQLKNMNPTQISHL